MELGQSQPALNALIHLSEALETAPSEFMKSICTRIQKERRGLA
jgi:hypothetical protein